MKPTRPGFTLIELLLYVGILSTLLTAITLFFSLTLEARIKTQSVNEVDQQGALIMETITRTIRNASSVTTPAQGVTTASLTLVVPTAALSPTIFSLDGTTLQIKEGSATAVPLSSSNVQVTSLSFKNVSQPGVQSYIDITFTLKRTDLSGGRNEYDYQQTFTSGAEVGW